MEREGPQVSGVNGGEGRTPSVWGLMAEREGPQVSGVNGGEGRTTSVWG